MITFVNKDERRSFVTEGACCSSSWIEHLEGVDNILGHLVIAVEDVEIDKVLPTNRRGYDIDEHGEEHESLQLYGVKITTDVGTALLEFRNSSNGYYGGSISYTEAPVHKDVNPVTEDF
jgi:hypothetical protein